MSDNLFFRAIFPFFFLLTASPFLAMLSIVQRKHYFRIGKKYSIALFTVH